MQALYFSCRIDFRCKAASPRNTAKGYRWRAFCALVANHSRRSAPSTTPSIQRACAPSPIQCYPIYIPVADHRLPRSAGNHLLQTLFISVILAWRPRRPPDCILDERGQLPGPPVGRHLLLEIGRIREPPALDAPLRRELSARCHAQATSSPILSCSLTPHIWAQIISSSIS